MFRSETKRSSITLQTRSTSLGSDGLKGVEQVGSGSASGSASVSEREGEPEEVEKDGDAGFRRNRGTCPCR